MTKVTLLHRASVKSNLLSVSVALLSLALVRVDCACALGQTAPADLVRTTFEQFRKASPELSSRGPGKLVFSRHPSFYFYSDGAAGLLIDAAGHVSCKRAVGWLGPSVVDLDTPTNNAVSALRSRPSDASLIERTRQLASAWLETDRLAGLRPEVKHESLLLARFPDGPINESRGRTVVRLEGKDFLGSFFQAVFDPAGALLRLDVVFDHSRAEPLTRTLFAGDLAPSPHTTSPVKPLGVGCFFDPNEYRFEISALTVEGETFLDSQHWRSNPFGRDHFDVNDWQNVVVPTYRQSLDYRWWAWNWWHRYGYVGAFRGNLMVQGAQSAWESPNQVLFHRSLASYNVLEGHPTHTKVITLPHGPRAFPNAAGETMEPAFYQDLESCNVAFFFTHGGRIQGAYQLRRGLDEWFKLMPPAASLGDGKLRHLFLDGCAAFTCRREPKDAHLVETWIRTAKINGLRTASGFDGVADLRDRSGWRFFGYYNKWESISDSWAFAVLDEYMQNCPVTVSYGETAQEALHTLLTGRFSEERAAAKVVAVSLWSSN